MNKRIALNISTWKLVKFNSCEDGRLYSIDRSGYKKYIGKKENYVIGVSEINKLL